jgi:hypothetical protein
VIVPVISSVADAAREPLDSLLASMARGLEPRTMVMPRSNARRVSASSRKWSGTWPVPSLSRKPGARQPKSSLNTPTSASLASVALLSVGMLRREYGSLRPSYTVTWVAPWRTASIAASSPVGPPPSTATVSPAVARLGSRDFGSLGAGSANGSRRLTWISCGPGENVTPVPASSSCSTM